MQLNRNKMQMHETRSILANVDVMKVPSGWLYIGFDGQTNTPTCMTFVPLDLSVKSVE